MALTIKKDFTKLQKMKKNISLLESSSVDVGIFEDSVYTGSERNRPLGHNAGVNVATIAEFNEYGTITNPQRPFRDETIRSVIRNKTRLGMAIEQALIGNVPKATQSIGKYIKDLMYTVVDSWIMRDSNSVSTIKEKGFNKPLEWSGTLLKSIDYRVTRRT